MSNAPFVTCDLLDDNPEKDIQVVTPSMDGKFFKSYGARKSFGGQVVTVKCFEDNSRVKELLATDGTGKVLVVDGGASMRCALMGDMIAESAVKHHWNGVVIYGCVRDVDAIAELDLRRRKIVEGGGDFQDTQEAENLRREDEAMQRRDLLALKAQCARNI